MNKKILSVSSFSPAEGSVWTVNGDTALMGCEGGTGARVWLDPAVVAETNWQDYRYMALEVNSRQYWSLVFMYEIWEKGNDSEEPDLTIRFSFLPNQNVRLVLPLSALDAQHIFLARTPGKLRSFVTGKEVKLDNIGRFAIGLRGGWAQQRLDVKNIFLTDEQPEYPFHTEPFVDVLGQRMSASWPGKVETVEEMVEKVLAEKRELEAKGWYGEGAACSVNDTGARDSAKGEAAACSANGTENAEKVSGRSRYGGWLEKQFAATGFFRLEKDEKRWWLVDPDGYAFLTAGMDCVSPEAYTPVDGLECCYSWLPEKDGEYSAAWTRRPWKDEPELDYLTFTIVNLIRTFGENWREEWEKLTTARLRDWGFNTIGAFSNAAYVRNSPIPYTHSLMGYPSTKHKIYRDFPDVFSEEFRQSAAEYAAQMEPVKNDDRMIGYYMRNEPEWAFAYELSIAEELLADPYVSGSKKEMIAFLRETYSEVSALNQAWGIDLSDFDDLLVKTFEHGRTLSEEAEKDLNEFSRRMICEYVKTPALALRAVDPNHLNLGMRYAFILYPEQAAGCEYMDVFSINCYKIDPTEVLRKVADVVKMPVMIGEFHFGALDRSLEATGIIGVASQEDRGKAYRYYLNHAIHVPECVGVQYFEFNDQAQLGRSDGENYQIGFVDVCGMPEIEMVEAAKYTHEHMYKVADGQEDYVSPEPKRIISNMAS